MTDNEQGERRRLGSTVDHMRAIALAVPEPRRWLIIADGCGAALTSLQPIRERKARHVVR
jgi:hypothetical protein